MTRYPVAQQDLPQGATDALETFSTLTPLMAILLVMVLIAFIIMIYVFSRGKTENKSADTIKELSAALTKNADVNQRIAERMGDVGGAMEVTSEILKNVTVELRAMSADSGRTLQAAQLAEDFSRQTHEQVTKVLPGTITTAIARAIQPVLQEVRGINETVGLLQETIKTLKSLDPALVVEMSAILEQSKTTLTAFRKVVNDPPIPAETVQKLQDQEALEESTDL